MSPLVSKAIEIARAEVGTKEVGGNNRGPRVEEYLASVGLPPGESWCAAFAFFCFARASKTLGVENPCPRTGGALKMMRQSQIGYHVDEPAEGCLVFENHGDGLGHVSICLEVHPNSLLVLAGNSNTDGSRNGVEVCIHSLRRDNPKICGYVDYSRELVPQEDPTVVA